jgi:trigger factor
MRVNKYLQSSLPRVSAPFLKDLRIVLSEPPPIREEDLLQRFTTHLRHLAVRRERTVGEPLAVGDDIELDMLGSAADRVIPFSVQRGFKTELGAFPQLPGLAEAISKLRVGSAQAIELNLPPTYPVRSMAGLPARIQVTVRRAFQLTLPDPESPATLMRMGGGATLAEIMAKLREDLDAEAGNRLMIEAQHKVLDELAVRVDMVLPAALIDDEVRLEWDKTEGQILIGQGFTTSQLQKALGVWLEDQVLRSDAERRLRISLALNAISERYDVTPTREGIHDLLNKVSFSARVSVADVKQALSKDEVAGRHVLDYAARFAAIRHVMALATFHFAASR